MHLPLLSHLPDDTRRLPTTADAARDRVLRVRSRISSFLGPWPIFVYGHVVAGGEGGIRCWPCADALALPAGCMIRLRVGVPALGAATRVWHDMIFGGTASTCRARVFSGFPLSNFLAADIHSRLTANLVPRRLCRYEQQTPPRSFVPSRGGSGRRSVQGGLLWAHGDASSFRPGAVFRTSQGQDECGERLTLAAAAGSTPRHQGRSRLSNLVSAFSRVPRRL
jgi:hypothetical protein